MKLNTYPDAEMMAMDVANRLAGELENVLLIEDRVRFVVAGGGTPAPIYDVLCAADLDWSRVDILLSDERWVPQVHVRSNARMLRERLLVERAAKANFIPFYISGDMAADLAELNRDIAANLPHKVQLLGMGGDMHTASLFPRAPGLSEALSVDAPPLLGLAPEGQDKRVSLSANVLRGALSTHVVITGEAKRKAVEAAAKMRAEDAPISLVLGNAEIHWAPEE